MADQTLAQKDISDLVTLLISGKVSSREIVSAFASNLERFNPLTNAFVTYDVDRALANASSISGLTPLRVRRNHT